MQRTRKSLRVTTFGNSGLKAQSDLANRFARGTMPMQSTMKMSLGDPVVWFREERTKSFSDKVSEAYQREDSAPDKDGFEMRAHVEIEPSQPSITDDISEVLFESIDLVNEENTSDEGAIPLQSSEIVKPDIVFPIGSGPVFTGKDPTTGGTTANVRKRIAGKDLWTVVFGTLVLSIGAQFVLQGFGLTNL